jgi:hypothetical protein
VPPLKDSLYLKHEHPPHLKPACKISLLREFGGVISVIVLFGERLGVGKILGGAVIFLGVYLARRR